MPDSVLPEGSDSDEDIYAQLEIDPKELAVLLDSGENFLLIDIRDPWELEVVSLSRAVAIPISNLPQQVGSLDAKCRTVLLCHHGMRSAHAAIWLRQQGFNNAISVRGGIDAYAREVDRSLPTY